MVKQLPASRKIMPVLPVAKSSGTAFSDLSGNWELFQCNEILFHDSGLFSDSLKRLCSQPWKGQYYKLGGKVLNVLDFCIINLSKTCKYLPVLFISCYVFLS